MIPSYTLTLSDCGGLRNVFGNILFPSQQVEGSVTSLPSWKQTLPVYYLNILLVYTMAPTTGFTVLLSILNDDSNVSKTFTFLQVSCRDHPGQVASHVKSNKHSLTLTLTGDESTWQTWSWIVEESWCTRREHIHAGGMCTERHLLDQGLKPLVVST